MKTKNSALLDLPYHPPLDWQTMLAFFQARAVPGVELVEQGVYQRVVCLGGRISMLRVSHAERKHALRVSSATLTQVKARKELAARVRRMFDLDADMNAISRVLVGDHRLRPLVRARPGLRLPGAWDPFEAAVRAVVGQQISVKGARTILGRLVQAADREACSEREPLSARCFPTAEALSAASLEGVGLTRRRAATLVALSRAVADGEVDFNKSLSLEHFVRQLTRLPGIGDWTAQYIAMRGMGHGDAFPASDLGIFKALHSPGKRPTASAIRRQAEAWRPWRAYAAMHLWHG
ncbi:MAG: DNA-3-methyladenine glycosylase [Desulfosarcinaceae bacterium]